MSSTPASLGSPQAERAVLGAVLLDVDGTGALEAARANLDPRYLSSRGHQLIMKAMVALHDRREAVDAVTLAAELDRRGQLEEAGGAAYLAELIDGLPRAPNIPAYAQIVRENYARRRLARLGGSLRDAALAGEDVTDLLTLISTENGNGAETNLESLAKPVSIGELLAMDMPPREWIAQGFMQDRDIAMIHAFRGVGKSRVAQGLAVAVACGSRFLRWEAPRPRGVLFVDGELPREQLQEMLAQAVSGAGTSPAARLDVLSADMDGRPVLSLATDEGRHQVEAYLEDDVELLVLDSVSTLCPGAGPENEAEAWDSIQSWLLELRRRGVATLLVHHDGKGLTQRGTSKREDVLSQVVHLRRPSDYRPSEGARFELHYSKSRGITGDAADPIEVQLVTGPDDSLVWTHRELKDVTSIKCAALAEEGLTQREIAKELGVGLGTVNRALKRANS